MAALRKGTNAQDSFSATGEAEIFDGGLNYDKVSYEGSATGLTIDLSDLANNTGDAAGDSYISIERFVLTLKDDRFIGSTGKDTINGRNGNDHLSGGENDDILLGDYGRDTLEGGDGNDGIWGGSLEDLIAGGAGDDDLFGDSHNDTIDGGAGDDVMNGGTGIDLASYASALAGVTVSLAGSGAQATGGSGADSLVNFENLEGSAFADRLSGDAGANLILGGAGDDTLAGGGGADTLDGGDGFDVISFAGAAEGADVTLGVLASDLVLRGIEGVEGTSHTDSITGDSGDNVIMGGADSGTVEMVTAVERFFQLSDDIFIPIELIDEVGEWVVVPKLFAVENDGRLDVLGRADGDGIFAITNGFDDARDWNFSVKGKPSTFDLGVGGEIGPDSTIIFNAGPGNAAVVFNIASTDKGFPSPKNASKAGEKAVDRTVHVAGDVADGDVLTGGAGRDTFRYRDGDGVDRITDFQKGIDAIDIADHWLDGDASNGEALAKAYRGGTMIQFSDASADGVVDNAAIIISSLSIGDYDTSILV